jgi:transcriptional regulator with XRE-family HTH domain
MLKTFIGPRLRRLRLENQQTQAQMARALGVSTSYVNLLEKNERSVSVPVLLKLFEAYGVDWRDIADDDDTAVLADLRAALQDPLFETGRPDLAQLRAAQSHSPDLAASFLKLHRAYLAVTDQLLSIAGAEDPTQLLSASPESTVHSYFRRHRNHFPALETAAEGFWDGRAIARDEIYPAVKQRLLERLGLRVRLVEMSELPNTLREYDETRREILLSEAFDHPNRVFQLVHVAGLVEHREILDGLLAQSGLNDAHGLARCRIELANYFAAAVLMPYGPQFRAGLPPRHHAATQRRARGAVLLPANRQGRQRDQAVQLDRFPPCRTWRCLSPARRAHLVPDAGPDRAAIRRDA